MNGNAMFLGMALLAVRVAGSEPRRLSVTDPCRLLKPAEVQGLTPDDKVGAGVSSILSSGATVCKYTWGAGKNAASGRFGLSLTITPAAKMFPGMTPATIKLGIQRMVNPGDVNSAVIPGVGEAAVFQSNTPILAATTAYVKGMILGVSFEGRGAMAHKEQVIALLKAAAARL